MKTFWVLIRKDRRLYRSAAIATVIFVVAPYLFVVQEFSGFVKIVATLAFPIGMMLLAVAAAMFGGLSFAGEKRNRASEFLAMLPASRLQIVASKLLVSGCYLTLACTIHAAGLCAAMWVDRSPTEDLFQVALLSVAWVAVSAGLFIFVFGMAWLLSTLLDSAAIAAACSLAAMWVIYCLIPLPWASGNLFHEFFSSVYGRASVVGWIGLLPGLLCVSAGALIFRKQFSN